MPLLWAVVRTLIRHGRLPSLCTQVGLFHLTASTEAASIGPAR